MSRLAVPRSLRAVLSAICWVSAVASAVLTSAAFAGGGILCESGRHEACKPQTWLLVLGIALAIAFGVAGAALYKPRTKREPRFPWEYPK